MVNKNPNTSAMIAANKKKKKGKKGKKPKTQKDIDAEMDEIAKNIHQFGDRYIIELIQSNPGDLKVAALIIKWFENRDKHNKDEFNPLSGEE